MPPLLPRPLALRVQVRPLNTAMMGAGFLGSFALFVRVLASAYSDNWSGLGAAFLLTATLAAFALHSWNVATGRGWKNSLEGERRTERLHALEALLAQGRIRRAEYLEERAKLLRGP